MALRRGIVAIVVVVIFQIQICLSEINRQSFPKGFVFGTASSAFQYEGAVTEDGRGPSVWDTFSHSHGKILDNSNADVAVDQYHRYEEDAQLMKDMEMDAYRFSISWSRIFPNGSGEINEVGIDHYNKLINALLAKGIEPYVTLYHWDLPQALEDKYKGWLSPLIIKDFATYAEICFQKFGDRVKHWITFNEPHTFAMMGYDLGLQAPGRCSILLHQLCRNGNSATEPYVVAHNVLISHAIVADIYRKKYKKLQGGSIGISLDVIWFESATNSKEDIEATQRALDFQLGWFLDPLVFGDYPTSMRSRVGNRLSKFSKSQASLLKGSLDFVGINHYTTFYAMHNASNLLGVVLHDYISDSGALTLRKLKLNLSNQSFKFDRLFEFSITFLNEVTRNLSLVIGMDDPNDPFISIKDALKDEKRIRYHNDYLINLLASITENGCNVKGYFVWSLLDNWEWQAGFTSRFGLYFIDYKDNMKRYPKQSVEWFKKFLKST
ncbi:Beta-glucosidase 40 [Spatholobus suberectus]|nr:Beta-glucosidase 40 [Spatholobus suberectus]